jgi:hypothetical protein
VTGATDRPAPEPRAPDEASEFEAILDDSTDLRPGPSRRPQQPRSPEERLTELTVQDRRQRVQLKRHLAYGAFAAVGLQLLVANAAFYVYGFANAWEIEPEVMVAWLSATVVETIGIVLIIARNLFPQPHDD